MEHNTVSPTVGSTTLNIRTNATYHFTNKGIEVFPDKSRISLVSIVKSVALRGGVRPIQCWKKVEETVDANEFSAQESGDVHISCKALTLLTQAHLSCLKSWFIFNDDGLSNFISDFTELVSAAKVPHEVSPGDDNGSLPPSPSGTRSYPTSINIDAVDVKNSTSELGVPPGVSMYDGLIPHDRRVASLFERDNLIALREEVITDRETALSKREEVITDRETSMRNREISLRRSELRLLQKHNEFLEKQSELEKDREALEEKEKELEDKRNAFSRNKRPCMELNGIARKIFKLAKEMMNDARSRSPSRSPSSTRSPSPSSTRSPSPLRSLYPSRSPDPVKKVGEASHVQGNLPSTVVSASNFSQQPSQTFQ